MVGYCIKVRDKLTKVTDNTLRYCADGQGNGRREMAKHHRQLDGSTVDLHRNSILHTNSDSVTPSVIPCKEEMVQVTVSDKMNLDRDVGRLETIDCLFENKQVQRKGDMQQ